MNPLPGIVLPHGSGITQAELVSNVQELIIDRMKDMVKAGGEHAGACAFTLSRDLDLSDDAVTHAVLRQLETTAEELMRIHAALTLRFEALQRVRADAARKTTLQLAG